MTMGRGKSGSGGGGGTATGRQLIRSMGGGSSGVANAVFDEIETRMGRQYRRAYAEGLASNGVNDIHFPDMFRYVTRNNGVPESSLPKTENRPYNEVLRDALGKRAYDALDRGMRDGAQRWLDEHPTRRRRRRS